MARRSHNETFILLRNNAQKNRSFYRDFNKDDERVKLVNSTGDDDEDDEIYDMELGGNPSTNPNDRIANDVAFPSWMSSLDEFRYESFNIREKIEQLKKIQLEHLKQQNTAIFADEETNEKSREYEMEIDRRCQELHVLFNRLHSILMHFKTLKNYCNTGKGFNNRMITIILRNIFQFQVHEIVSLTQLFRSCQRVYLERKSEATKIDPEFVITFDMDLLEQEFNKDNNNYYDDFNNHHHSNQTMKSSFDDDVFTSNESNIVQQQNNRNQIQLQQQKQISMDDQLQLDSNINAHMKEREKEMNTIMKSFIELNQLFQEVQTLVVDQGSALDRIDYNIEQVENKVELGAVSLEKAHRSITRMRKFKLILGAGFILFLLFLLIIIKS